QDLLIIPAGMAELQRRELDAFLEDLRATARHHRAEYGAADIGPVRPHRDERDEILVVFTKYGRIHRHVVEMLPAGLRIIGDERITRTDRLNRMGIEHRFERRAD